MDAWDIQLERWSTIVANVLTVGTIVAAAVPVARWASGVRRELAEIRRRLPEGKSDFVEVANFYSIQIGAAEGELWNVKWSRLPDQLHEPSIRSGLASITSKRLARLLRKRSPRVLLKPVVIGALRYVSRDGRPEQVEIYRLDYVDGDVLRFLWFKFRYRLWRLFSGT